MSLPFFCFCRSSWSSQHGLYLWFCLCWWIDISFLFFPLTWWWQLRKSQGIKVNRIHPLWNTKLLLINNNTFTVLNWVIKLLALSAPWCLCGFKPVCPLRGQTCWLIKAVCDYLWHDVWLLSGCCFEGWVLAGFWHKSQTPFCFLVALGNTVDWRKKITNDRVWQQQINIWKLK